MSDLITIAVPKGYLLGETVKAFEKIGIHFPPDFENSRRLFTYDLDNKFKLLIVRPWDVPAYVEQGAADLGVVGKDVLEEQEPDVFDLKDLGFGGCSLVIAGFKDQKISDLNHHCKVSTKYPRCTERYFRAIGKKASIIKLYGAIELSPLTGLSDVICDLTATGKTLKEHDLHILDTVFYSTAHLISNRVSLKVHYDTIKQINDQL
jgi:ATP phosphoribosyltransferase